MRVGQKGTLTRVWAETGSRPSAPRSDGYQSVYLVGAVCPSRDLGCARILPRCDTAAMTLFLDELSGHVVPGVHAILVLDGAGCAILSRNALLNSPRPSAYTAQQIGKPPLRIRLSLATSLQRPATTPS